MMKREELIRSTFESSRKFSYFLVGGSIALFGLIYREIDPVSFGWNESSLQLSALICILVSVAFGVALILSELMILSLLIKKDGFDNAEKESWEFANSESIKSGRLSKALQKHGLDNLADAVSHDSAVKEAREFKEKAKESQGDLDTMGTSYTFFLLLELAFLLIAGVLLILAKFAN